MDTNEIFQSANGLIQEIKNIPDYNEKHMLENHNRFKKNKNLEKLIQNYFELYKAIISKTVTEDNIYILIEMLECKKKINNKELTVDEATKQMSTMLANNLGRDWGSLKKKKKD